MENLFSSEGPTKNKNTATDIISSSSSTIGTKTCNCERKKPKQSSSSIIYELITISDKIDTGAFTKKLLKWLQQTCMLDGGFISSITNGWDFVVIQKIVKRDGKKTISGIAVADKYMSHDGNGGIKDTGVELLALCVSSKFRDFGLGKKLLKYFEEHCVEINAREAFLYSVTDKIGWYSALGYHLAKPNVLIIGDKKFPTDGVVRQFKSFLSQEKWPVLTNETKEGAELMAILNKHGFVKQDSGRTISSRATNGILMTKELIPVADFKPNDTKGFKKERKAPLDRSGKRVKI